MSNSNLYRYQKVYNDLKHDIVSGVYPPHSFLPSERELCERFSAWRVTIRQALDLLCADGIIEKKVGVGTYVLGLPDSDSPTSPPTTASVDTVDAGTTKKVIGFFVTDSASKDMRITQPYYFDLLCHLEELCFQNDFMLLYASVSSPEDMKDLLKKNPIELAVFLSHSNFSCIDMASSMDVPCLLVHETYRNYTSISCDHAMTGYLSIKHLYERGHRDIGIIAGRSSYMSTQDKLAGCLRACNEFGIPFPTNSKLQYGNWEQEGGYECAKKMFTTPGAKMPTALFVFNDSMCLGAVYAVRELGYSIPDDVSIIGSDNMKRLLVTEPNLTTIDTNIKQTASMIFDCARNSSLLCQQHNGIKILTPVSLVVRNSVRDLNAHA